YPDDAEIGDFHQHIAHFHILALLEGHRLNHTAEGREQRERVGCFACFFEIGNLLLGDVPKLQTALGRLDQSLRCFARVFAFGLVTHAQELNEFPLAREQVRAVDRQKGRILIDQLAWTSDIQFLDVTIDTRYELPVACFIGHNQADCANGVAQRLALHLCVTHANLLLTFDWDNEFARLFAALHLSLFHAWHAGHPLHFAARRLFLAAFYLFSLRLWRSFAALLLHHGHEIHRANGAFSRILGMHRRMHRAGVIIDVVWFSRGAFF